MMVSLGVVMRDIFAQSPYQRAFTEQNELGKALLLHRADPPFAECVQIWAARRNLKTPDPFRCQHMVERHTELRISVMQHVTAVAEPSGGVADGIARHLSEPGFSGMACDAGKRDASGLEIEEEQDVVGGEPTPGQDLDGEEVGSRKHSHVGGDEVLPGRGLATLWRGWDAVTLKHVSDRLV